MLNMYKGRTYLNLCPIVTSVRRLLTVFHILLCSQENKGKYIYIKKIIYKKNLNTASIFRLFCSVLLDPLWQHSSLQSSWVGWASANLDLGIFCHPSLQSLSSCIRSVQDCGYATVFRSPFPPKTMLRIKATKFSLSCIRAENLTFHSLTLWVVGDLDLWVLGHIFEPVFPRDCSV